MNELCTKIRTELKNKVDDTIIKIEIVPNQEIKIGEVTYDLTKIQDLENVRIFVKKQIKGYLDQELEQLMSDLGYEYEEIESVTNYTSAKETFTFLLYPNLLKTGLIANFLDLISEQKQLDIVLNKKSSGYEITKEYFPMIDKRVIGVFKNIFATKQDERYSILSTALISESIFNMFEDTNKFTTFIKKMEEEYENLFGSLEYAQSHSFNILKEESIFNKLLRENNHYVKKDKHAAVNILIDSVSPLVEECHAYHENAEMGECYSDGELSFFEALDRSCRELDLLINNLNSTIQEVEEMEDGERKEKALTCFKKFKKEYKIKNIPEFHDELMSIQNKIDTILTGRKVMFGEEMEETKKMNYTEEIIQKYEFQRKEYEFRLAKTKEDLVFIGEAMEHCVGGYFEYIKTTKETYIVVLFENGFPVVCMEIKEGKIVQAKKHKDKLLSKYKKKDREILREIEMYMHEKNIQKDTMDLYEI